ncbi:SMC-Scp complex subunit ScpB [Aeoliella sp.]|uniref:SMC-Scp complex subunit ScpB n=1 Tax=Aeoliella sp. TaxID=2795800 RepID=UPI003CCB97DE
MADGEDKTDESPLSIKRLTNAFAAMLGRKSTAAEEAAPREAAVDTRSITEALLFVGRPDNQPLSAESIAATMRDITPDEVSAVVEQLNAEYAEDDSAMTIVESAAGYRLTLREDLSRVRDKFYGKVQQATLTPAAMEVLSIVAYRQPVDLKTIDAMRAQKSQSLASSLVRRGLVEIRRPEKSPRKVQYATTGRFLQVFGLSSIEQLPQSAEFEAA